MALDHSGHEEFHILEHEARQLLMQKEATELELNEVSNALNEVEKTTSDIYRMIGSVMLKAEKSDIKKELLERKKILDLRLQSIEKYESTIASKLQVLQKDHKPHN